MNRAGDPRFQSRAPAHAGPLPPSRGNPRGPPAPPMVGGVRAPSSAPPHPNQGRGGFGRPPMLGERGPGPGIMFHGGRGPPLPMMGRGHSARPPPPPPPPPPPRVVGLPNQRGPPPYAGGRVGGLPPLHMPNNAQLLRPPVPMQPPAIPFPYPPPPHLNGQSIPPPPPPRQPPHFSHQRNQHPGPFPPSFNNNRPLPLNQPIHQATSVPSGALVSPASLPSPSFVTPPNPIMPGGVTAPGPIQPATATSSIATKEQIDLAWSEHTAPTGVKYYYNAITKESTYTNPKEVAAKVQNQVAAPVTSQERPWAEYVDSNTGRKYYSNGLTTTWEQPEGFQGTTTATDSHGEKDQSETTSDSPKKKKRKSARGETEFGSKEEAIAAFKGLLLAKDISPTFKWNELVKMCSSDPRWEACEDVLSTGERKQALAEYQTKRANELRSLERQERARAKEIFVQMLSEVVPTLPGFSGWSSRFPEVRDQLAKDDRFHLVVDEETRESLFLDFCEEFRKRDERRKRSKLREAQDSFISFLREKESQGILTFASTWNSFLASLLDEDRSDTRFTVSPQLSDADRQLFFADFVIELQTAEDDKRRRIRDARRRAEKAQREAYQEALVKHATEGKILPYSQWRDVESILANDPSYGPVYDQGRDIPKEVFDEFVDEWNDSYLRDRAILSQIMFPKSGKCIAVVNDTVSYETFKKALLDAVSESAERYGEVRHMIKREEPVSSVKLFFNEILRGTAGKYPSSKGMASRRGYESSEDEGEIVEEGEIDETKDSFPSEVNGSLPPSSSLPAGTTEA